MEAVQKARKFVNDNLQCQEGIDKEILITKLALLIAETESETIKEIKLKLFGS